MEQVYWIVPVALVLLLLLQLIYLFALNVSAPRERQERAPRRARSAPRTANAVAPPPRFDVAPPPRFDAAPEPEEKKGGLFSRPARARTEPAPAPTSAAPAPATNSAPAKPAPAKPATATTTIHTPPKPIPAVSRPAPVPSSPPASPVRQPEPAVASKAPADSGREPVVQTRRSRSDKANTGVILPLAGVEQQTPIRLPSAAEFSIGRFYNPDQNVLVGLDEKSISRKHATLTYDSGANAYFLTDNNSSYGTFVLVDNRLEQLTAGRKERVFNEDIIQFGNIVQVRLTLPVESRSNSTRL